MKAIVIYASKYGGAAEIASRIAARIDGAVTFKLEQGDEPTLTDFDCVIFGSSVYGGSFRKEAKIFLQANSDELCTKKLGFFVSAMSESESTAVFKSNVPERILTAATAVCSPGGMFDPEKGNFIERLIIKVVTKKSDFVNTINDEKIDDFIQAMKE